MEKMKNCIIIVNKMSGNNSLAVESALRSIFGEGFDIEFFYITENAVLPDVQSYDRIVVCGGDGTLHNIINCKIKSSAEIIYCPFGTLNECATGTSSKDDYTFSDVGLANDRRFTYVCACGTFTPLGYAVKDKHKQRFKSLAYLSKVLSQYRAEFIKAKIQTGNISEEGVYTLIMAIESPKCFGFNFNKMYKRDDGKMHLLAIKSPKHSGFRGAAQIFFPLFRAFFVGFKRPYRSKKMLFVPFTDLTLTFDGETDFCMDGERVPMQNQINIRPIKNQTPIRVISANAIGQYLRDEVRL